MEGVEGEGFFGEVWGGFDFGEEEVWGKVEAEEEKDEDELGDDVWGGDEIIKSEGLNSEEDSGG